MNLGEKYLIQEELGGAKIRKFSRVFKGIEKSSGKAVVLKTLIKTDQNLLAQERLLAESTLHFNREGLPKILDFIATENEFILVKEFEDGIPLVDFIQTFKPKNRAFQLIPILEQIILLLNEIHAQGLIHLDIKPSNLLVHTTDTELKVALIDFGLAYQIHSQEKRKLLFPLGYAAPECILNHLELVDRRSDYFSLAITIWQCIEGKLPLLHPNPSITTNLQLTHPLPEGNQLNKKQYACLSRLSTKPYFGLPPNQLSEKTVIEALTEARNKRYEQLEQFLDDWKACSTEKRSWFKF